MLFKFFFISLKFLLFLFTTLLLLLMAVYFGLQSSIIEQKLIPYLQPLIKEKSGFDVQIEQFRFDLFGHLYLNNLSLKKVDIDSNETIALGLKTLHLRYDIWQLIDKRIVINELSFDGLTLNAHLPLKKSSHQEPTSEDKASSLSHKELINLIGTPPIEFNLNKLEITPINIDLQLYSQEQNVHYKGKVAFNSSVLWSSSELHGTMAFSMDNSTLELLKNAKDKTKLLMHPMIDTQIKWQIKKSAKNLLLELKPIEFTLASGETNLFHNEAGKKVILDLEELKFRLNLKGTSELFNPTNTNLQWDLQQNFLTSNSYAEINDTYIGIDPLNLQLNLQGSITKIANALNKVAVQNRSKVDLKPMKVTLKKQDLSLIATPNYNLNLNTKVILESDENISKLNWQHPQAELFQQFNIEDLKFKQGKMKLSIEEQKWQLKGEFENNKILMNSDLNLKKLNTPFVLKPLSIINHQLSFVSDLKFREAQLATTLKLNKLKPILNLSLNVNNQAHNLLLNPSIELNLPQSLNHYVKELEPLNRVGDINLDIKGKVQVTHHKDNALDVNWSQHTKMPFKSDLKFTLKQLSPPKQGSLKIKGPLKTQLLLSHSSSAHYKSKISMQSKGIFYPPLKKPLALNFWIDNSFNESFSNIHSKANIVLNNKPFIKYNLHLIDKSKSFSLNSWWDIYADTKLKSFLPQLEPLEKIGNIHLQNQLNINLVHPFKTVKLLNPSQLKGLNTKVKFNGTLQQYGKNRDAQILIPKPLRFKHTIKWQEKRALLDATYNIEDFTVVDKLHLEQVSLGILADANHGIKPNAIVANIESNGSKVTLLSDKKPHIELSSLLLPLSLSVDGAVNQDANNLDLQQLKFSLGDRWLEQVLSGSASLDGKNSDIKGQTTFQLRDKLFKSPLPPLSGSGKLSIPWQMRLLESKWLSLQSEMIFDNLSLQSKELFVSGINGRFHIDEEIILHKDGNISFEYLLKTDPFQRVDFNRIEPYLNNQENLSIKTLKIADMTVGPIQAMIPIEQNLIQLQQFNMKLFGGHITGELYLNTAPKAWSFGLLMRVTQVDLRQILKDSNQFESAPISARIALEFDFSKRLLQGQIDITDISQSQLLQLLELLDPEHKDTQLDQVRDALGYAHPESVVIKMDGGLLNLSVSLSLLSNPITIRGLPLSPLIERFSADTLNQINQLPLKE